MNYGLYLSAAGTLTSMHRQDVLANNLANIHTAGFKPDLVTNRFRLPERLESLDTFADPQMLLEQLGGGTFADRTRISQRQGALAESKNPLDVAVQGEGYFVVADQRGGDAAALRLTRDGRFTLNTAGQLTLAANGMLVLDVNDQPIGLDTSAPVRIDSTGRIWQSGAEVARLQVAAPADATSLHRLGDNLLTYDGKRRPADGAIRQGHIESSAIDAIMAMNDMINASKAVNANITLMQYHDHLLGQAINTFARVA